MCSYIAINRCFPDSTDACELTQRSPYVGAPVAPPPPPSRGHGPSSGFDPTGGRQLSNQIPAFDIDLDELIRNQKLKSPQKFLTEGRRHSPSECTTCLTRSTVCICVNSDTCINIFSGVPALNGCLCDVLVGLFYHYPSSVTVIAHFSGGAIQV